MPWSAEWRPGARELTVHISTQVPHLIRKQLAESLRLSESDIRAVASDVGGGFGLKLGVFPEDVLACLHAMALRRPVKWVEDRAEHFRASTHARESVHDYRIAADATGRLTAMIDVYATDIGGWNSPFGSAQLSSVVLNGPYRVDHGYAERRVTLTNKTPIGAYRGYGQPEVNFAYERLMDTLARRVGMRPGRAAGHEHGEAAGHAVAESDRCHVRQRRLRAVPADGCRCDRLGRPP